MVNFQSSEGGQFSVVIDTLEGVRKFASALPKLDAGVKADFAKTRGILARVKSPAKDAIEAKVEKQYAEREATLAAKLASVGSAESTVALKATVTDTSRWLASITPAQPYQPLGTQLPHRIVNAHPGPPVLGTSIAPAYAPNTKGAEPSALPITPTDADTSTTVEVQFTDDIRSLATSLGNDPVRMYEYVRNTIDFEPYYGSRKGAEETLLEGSGNDMDQASLLIALYRASGIPARYVSGVVDIPIAKAENWVGAATPEAAARVFASSGTPTTSLVSGGGVKMLRIAHTWAEVYVPYENYRGVGPGIDVRRWVPLDSSWKAYADTGAGVVTLSGARESMSGVSGVLQRSISESQGVVAFSTAAARSDMSAAFSSSLANSSIAASGTDLLQAREVAGRSDHVLPPSTPYHVDGIGAERQDLGGVVRDGVTVTLDDSGGGVVLVANFDVKDLAGKSAAVAYVPATAADLAIIQAAGGLASAPAYAVNLLPEIVVDGQIVATGHSSALLGSTVNLTVTGSPSGEQLGQFTSAAGGELALVLDLGGVSPKSIVRISGALTPNLDLVANGSSIASSTARDTVAQILSLSGQMYFFDADSETKSMARRLGVAWHRDTSYATVADEARPVSVLGTTAAVGDGGVSIDVDSLDAVTVAPAPGLAAAFEQLSGLVASGLEGSVLSSSLGGHEAGVSTTSIINRALDEGVPLVHIESGNVSVLDGMQLPSEVKAAIRNAVAAGYSVVAPAATVDLDGWTGAGWVVLDEATGSEGFMISGGDAGGWVWSPAVWALLGMGAGMMTGSAGTGAQIGVTVASVVSVIIDVNEEGQKLEDARTAYGNSVAPTQEFMDLQADIGNYQKTSYGACALFLFLQYGSSTTFVQDAAPEASTIVAVGAFLAAEETSYFQSAVDLEIEMAESDFANHPRPTP